MIISFLLWVNKKVLSKVYKIWISSINIILEDDSDSSLHSLSVQKSISSQKFIYPETVITDLSRKSDITQEDGDYSII